MTLSTLLSGYAPLDPSRCKIHLATTGRDGRDPLDIYCEGRFQKWQEHQHKRNFERAFIVSLIRMPAENTWLFAGIHTSENCVEQADGDGFMYSTNEVAEFSELTGRLVVTFARPGRQSYLLAENWINEIRMKEIFPKKLSIKPFTGFKNIRLSKAELGIIISESVPSWKSALTGVAGVYLISDTSNGKLYVGSASGIEGIWGRWCAYANDGHGGNRALLEVVKELGDAHTSNYQFSILEVCDPGTGIEEILQRESFWKQVLCTSFGYNRN